MPAGDDKRSPCAESVATPEAVAASEVRRLACACCGCWNDHDGLCAACWTHQRDGLPCDQRAAENAP